MLHFLCFLLTSFSCTVQPATTEKNEGAYSTFPHATEAEAFGNFSVELLYHTSVFQTDNFIICPFNAWAVLATAAEGALSSTRTEVIRALRLTKNRNMTRSLFQSWSRELDLHTTTIQLARFNAMLIDKTKGLENDFREASRFYDTFTIPVNLTNARSTARRANKAVSVATKGLITKIADDNDFGEPQLVITSAAYFKGQWTAAFNYSYTSKRPFYDSKGVQTGYVNMMYNRFMYPVVDMDDLQCSVIELPYGTDGRLALLIMLPKKGVSLMKMLQNFQKVPLGAVFAELRLDQQEHGDDVIECSIPRFKIESKLELKDVLKKFGIIRLFNGTAELGRLSRFGAYVTKVIHKTEIEVTEEGITGIGTAPELKPTPGLPKFEANRPFVYFLIVKTTNTVLFEGFYENPYLY